MESEYQIICKAIWSDQTNWFLVRFYYHSECICVCAICTIDYFVIKLCYITLMFLLLDQQWLSHEGGY